MGDAVVTQETMAGAENPLAGTKWRLLEIRSMDDAIGTVRPEDPLDTPPADTKVLSGEFVFQDGILLKPRK